MADYGSVTIQGNKAAASTDTAPDWTGTAMNFGGSAGQHEMRWVRTGGGGGASIGSAAWPPVIKPGSGTYAIEECWIYTTSDNSGGYRVYGYDGGKTYSNQFRLSFDAAATPASANLITAFQDTADTEPTPGTQTANATDGRNIVNGSTDTGNKSYLKANFFGSGYPAAGSQETPVDASIDGTTVAVTSGTGSGVVNTVAGAYLTNWQDLQGFTHDYIAAVSIAKATQAYYWYFALALFMGVNMQTGNMSYVPICLQYTWT